MEPNSPTHPTGRAPLTQPYQIEKGLEWERNNHLLKAKITHRRWKSQGMIPAHIRKEFQVIR